MLALSALPLLFGPCAPDPVPPPALRPAWVFGDHMVLPRRRAFDVWGEARPGAEVEVRIEEQRASGRADAEGRWRVTLSPLDTNYYGTDLTLRSGEEAIVLRDVLVGDVWLLAGQSNMAFPLQRAVGGREAAEEASQSFVRLLDRRGSPSGSRVVLGPEQLARITEEDYYQGAWTVAEPAAARAFSAVGWFFGRVLEEEIAAPVGLIHVAVGGSSTEGWIPTDRLLADAELAPLARDFLATELTHPFIVERTLHQLGRWVEAGRPEPRPRHFFEPGFLYDAAIAPLAPFAFEGVVWYQGESNAHLPELHARLFPLLIESWRDAFGRPGLPFAFVQLPGLNRPTWAEMRESQARALALPQTSMAVAIDAGHPTDVHPRDKRPVGERLARLVLADVYGHDVDARGPTLAGVVRDGAELVLRFDHAENGLVDVDGGDLEGFLLAGADRRFRPARARIDGGAVRLVRDGLAEPAAARYAWAPDPDCDLVDGSGLPAAPFRTDAWTEVRVACIGDSITYGYGIADRDSDSYPARLDALLGPGWEVRNFGRSGTCVVESTMRGDWARAYTKNPEHAAALAFEPHLVVCNLGINDVMAWSESGGEFVEDYLELIEVYRALPTRPRILIWSDLAPLFPGQTFHGDPRVEEIGVAIAEVARRASVATVDLRAPLAGSPEMFPDHIHPDAVGAARVAEIVLAGIEALGPLDLDAR